MKKVRISSNVVEPMPLNHNPKKKFVGRVLMAGETYELEDDQADKLMEAQRAEPVDGDVADEDPRAAREK